MSATPNLIEPARPAYCTPLRLVRQATGINLAPYYGGLSSTTAAVAAGATSLPVASGAGFAANSLLTISDGELTENVWCSAVAGNTLTVSATQSAHAGGTCVSSPGASGSLADTIGDASDIIDNYCQRAFYQQTVTETQRLIVDVEGRLFLRPRVIPATAVSAVTVTLMDGTVLPLTTTNVQIAADGRSVFVTPYLAPDSLLAVGALAAPLWRGSVGRVTTTYTGGYATLPEGVVRACIVIVNQLLAEAAANAAGLAGLQSLGIAGQLNVTRTPMGADLPPLAKTLLAPFQRRAA